MEGSNIGYQEWAIAIFLMTTNIKGTSSTKLAHDLGISQKSAWYMAMRIREAYHGKDPILLETVVEVEYRPRCCWQDCCGRYKRT